MLLDEIMARLTSQGVATTGAASTSWRLGARELQDSPDRFVAVIPTGGGQQEGVAPLDRPTFQLLVRDAKDGAHGTLEQKVRDADSAVNLFAGTLASWTYVDIQRQGDVLYLGRDENQRPMYSLNYQALRSRTS